MADQKLRILLAKPGLDGHDRGIRVIATALRDAGMEVIYTGLRQTPESIVSAAIQEDVDAIGVSVLSGAHMTLFPAILEKLKENDAEDIALFGGGIVPNNEKEELEKMGVKRIFTPGAPLEEIVSYINEEVAAGRSRRKLS